MVRRKERQKKGYLGRRSFGRGNVKNRRGSGNRGGRGQAGLHKHKYTWTVKFDPDHFGKHGFVRVNQKSYESINLFEINRKALLEQLEKKDGKFHFDFDGKILGSGKINFPIAIKALSWSKSAEEKVKQAGGQMLVLVPTTPTKK
ncbi:MAG: uL15m family ribosomal protein [Candidatus Micrarchaeota archaeon]